MSDQELPDPDHTIPLVFVIALDPDALETTRPPEEEADLSPEANPAAYARALRITGLILYVGAALIAATAREFVIAATLVVSIPLIVGTFLAADTISRGGRIR